MSSRKSSCTNTLTNYFNKKIKTTHDANKVGTSNSILIAITPVTTENSKSDVTDISYCFDQKVSNELKYKLLSNVWIPDEKFTFPISENRI